MVGLETLDLATYLGILAPVILVVVIWSLVWKGIALWKAGRNNHLVWFIVLLLVNTIGILEILYIFWFSKMNSSKKTTRKPKKKRR